MTDELEIHIIEIPKIYKLIGEKQKEELVKWLEFIEDPTSKEVENYMNENEGIKEAKNKCKPVILEPIMKVDIVVPEEYFGNVMGDITARRGKPLSQESRGNSIKFSAMVPLSEMFGYATSIRSNTQGRGTFQMVADHYEEVPKSIAEEIIKKSGN